MQSFGDAAEDMSLSLYVQENGERKRLLDHLAVVLAEPLTEFPLQPANSRYRKSTLNGRKTELTAAGAEAKAAGDHAGGDELGGAAGSCQVEEYP